MASMPSAHSAADDFDRALADWRVDLNTLDQDLKDKDAIEARVYDLWRNNDLFRALVEKQVDTIVGSKMILQCKPDFESLGATTDEAKSWCKTVEREWHKYANCEENWITADRSMDFTQLMRSACRQFIFTGEIISSREWRNSPLGYKTCFNLVSSNRLKTPKNVAVLDDQKTNPRDVFYGIGFDKYGAATDYYISSFNRKGGVGYNFNSNSDKSTKRYSRYNRAGVLQIFHIYEPFKPEYPRGISRAAAVLKKIKQLDRFHEADLEKAIIAASFAMVVTSPLGPEDVAAMLSGMDKYVGDGGAVAWEAGAAGDCKIPVEVQEAHDNIKKEICDRYIDIDGGKWIHAFQDEKVEMLQPHANMGTSEDFAKGHTKNVANGFGISYELGTGDFNGLSFSGGQLSLGIYEHSANIQRKLYVHKYAKLGFRSWMDEAMSRGTIPLLNGQSYFENKECYVQCEFSGAKRVHVDPVKNARSTSIDLGNGVISRTEVVNANGGDMEQVVRDRANEAAMMLDALRAVAAEKGIPLTPEQETSILVDIMATKEVSTPEIVAENQNNE